MTDELLLQVIMDALSEPIRNNISPDPNANTPCFTIDHRPNAVSYWHLPGIWVHCNGAVLSVDDHRRQLRLFELARPGSLEEAIAYIELISEPVIHPRY